MTTDRNAFQFPTLLCCLAGMMLNGCVGPLPSDRLAREVTLPKPRKSETLPAAERLTDENHGDTYELSPLSVISLAFDLQPDIKSSYERFKSEEARYDFFYVSRDSFTPRITVANSFAEDRANESVTRDRDHTVFLSAEKDFFDTTEMEVGLGFRSEATDQAIGDQPYVAAKLRYPLWGSREKLERTSEDIFRQNELNDAQLAYIQQARSRLERALFKYHEVVFLRRQLANLERWQSDLDKLAGRIQTVDARDMTSDEERVAAELIRVSASVRNQTGWHKIQLARLRAVCGIPFNSSVEILVEPFNPFEGATHQELLQASLATDPEIATLKNAMRNAEVQLDLARRGKWDVALFVAGESDLEGRGESEGVSDWSISAGFDVSAVDQRVTESLTRQARANIARFNQAIVAREDRIFTETLEPIVRIETLGMSRDELTDNLSRYEEDYASGLEDYLATELNIDDLLTRREDLYEQQNEIARLSQLVGFNIAELCSATGKFFELLKQD